MKVELEGTVSAVTRIYPSKESDYKILCIVFSASSNIILCLVLKCSILRPSYVLCVESLDLPDVVSRKEGSREAVLSLILSGSLVLSWVKIKSVHVQIDPP